MGTQHPAREVYPMNEKHGQNLIEIGVDLGVFTIANLLLEGLELDQHQLQKLSDLSAQHIELMTGMPAEDFALKVQPVIDIITKVTKGESI
jgi:predicted mannosyl-3-phosphoglycerate phosphatase (HAD superfamily)